LRSTGVVGFGFDSTVFESTTSACTLDSTINQIVEQINHEIANDYKGTSYYHCTLENKEVLPMGPIDH
tara:strand:- start:1 stop:204 length:204 start_codon:yes stop_codon:yes gene_type:complete